MTSIKPEKLSQALRLMAAGTFTPYAGGTDLMIEAQQKNPFLFIADLPELKRIELAEDGLRIGAAVTLSELEKHHLIPTLLRNAISEIGSPATRNMGTLTGNIVNASPAGDSLPVLYIFEAEVIVASTRGRRRLPIESFIVRRKQVDLQPDELVTEIVIPTLAHNVAYYQKYGGRRATSISKLAMATLARVSAEGRIETVRMAFASMGPKPVRVPDLDNICRDQTMSELALKAAELAEICAAACSPISDHRSTGAYRLDTAYRLADWFFRNMHQLIQEDNWS